MAHRLSIEKWVALALGFSLLFLASESGAARLYDAKKRARIARIYAPQIQQDPSEAYGLASFSYFLRRSELRGVVTGCSAFGKRKTSVRLAPGSALAFHDKIAWPHTLPSCQRTFGLTQNPTSTRRNPVLSAPNRVYLQLSDHRDATLLKGAYRKAITPSVAYHVYERQRMTCRSRSLFGFCRKYKVHRFYVVQYFVHLMFNSACNVHEGEHEGMVLLLDAGLFDAARTPIDFFRAIKKVGFYGHYHTRMVNPNQVTFALYTHPVAYMGAGGHALYPNPGSTALLPNFPIELRRGLRRVCSKRNRLSALTERHRSGGHVYRTWRKPSGQLKRPKNKALLLPPADAQLRKYIRREPSLGEACILARTKPGVRLCDVEPHSGLDRCCPKQRLNGYARWIQFAGRWGKQGTFATSMLGLAASQVGRLLRRWPLGRSMGNSGPFGPQFIHRSTWKWLNPFRSPSPTSPLWR